MQVYSRRMFDVLEFVYRHYASDRHLPDWSLLIDELDAEGFGDEAIHEALVWLGGLDHVESPAAWSATEPGLLSEPSQRSLRVYSVHERNHLDAACLSFLSMLATENALPLVVHEIAIDRAMATRRPVSLQQLKIMLLMVYWHCGLRPSTMVLECLCSIDGSRVLH